MDTEEPGKPSKSYRGWWIAAGVIFLAVTIVAFLWLNGQHRLQRKINALHAKGFPITFEEIEQKRKLPEGTPNAADLYQKAFDAYKPPSEQDLPLLPHVGSGKLPEPGVPLSEEMLSGISRFVESNQQTLALLKQGVMIPNAAFTPKGLMPYPHPLYSDSFKVCADLWELESILCIERKDYEGALNNIQDNIRFGDSLRRYPYLLDYLLLMDIHFHNIRIAERILNSPQIDENILTKMDRCLDYHLSPQLVEDLVRDKLPSLLEDQNYASSGIANLYWNTISRSNTRECIGILEELISAYSFDHPRRFQKVKAIENKVDGSFFYLHPLTQTEIPIMTMSIILNIQIETRFDSARVSIAVERYRLENGKLPDRLDELVPRYMEKVPMDPFDGKPLRYKRLEKGYTIYSIGENGKDDGGKKKIRGDKDFDYPFTVRR